MFPTRWFQYSRTVWRDLWHLSLHILFSNQLLEFDDKTTNIFKARIERGRRDTDDIRFAFVANDSSCGKAVKDLHHFSTLEDQTELASPLFWINRCDNLEDFSRELGCQELVQVPSQQERLLSHLLHRGLFKYRERSQKRACRQN